MTMLKSRCKLNLMANLKWTKKQIEVATLLTQGMPVPDVAKSLKTSEVTVYAVKKALKNGDSPDNAKQKKDKKGGKGSKKNAVTGLTPSGLGNSSINKSSGDKEGGDAKSGTQDSDDVSPSGIGKDEPTGLANATLLKFVPQVLTVPFSPILWNGYMCCLQKFGWPADTPFIDVLDTAMYYFLKDRGSTVQGWIDDDAVQQSQNGHQNNQGNNTGQEVKNADNNSPQLKSNPN